MNTILCNLKNLPKKNGGGEVYIADLLCIDDNSTVLFSRFINKQTYDNLSVILEGSHETQEQVYIPDIYFLFKIRNNDLIVDIDFDKFIADTDI